MKAEYCQHSLDQLKKSLAYAARMTGDLAAQGKMFFACEALAQIIPDLYLLKNGRYLEQNMVTAASTLGISLTDEDAVFLSGLEKALRFDDDYAEFVNTAEPGTVTRILTRISAVLN